jgi:hypothetical protein
VTFPASPPYRPSLFLPAPAFLAQGNGASEPAIAVAVIGRPQSKNQGVTFLGEKSSLARSLCHERNTSTLHHKTQERVATRSTLPTKSNVPNSRPPPTDPAVGGSLGSDRHQHNATGSVPFAVPSIASM